MPVELTGPEARSLMMRLTGRNVRPEDTKESKYGQAIRDTADAEFCEIYAENDWMHKDGRIRVGIRDKLSGECIEKAFTVAHKLDPIAGKTARLRHDKERREFWVRQHGPEECKKEVDEIWEKVSRATMVDWYGK